MFGGPRSPLRWLSSGESPDKQALAVWCAYTGQDKEAAQRWGWLEAVHPADREAAREAWMEAAHVQNVFTLTYRLCHIGGDYHSFKVLGVPLFTDAHQLQGWFVFFSEEFERPPMIDEDWEQRLLYSMIFTQAVLGIFSLSLDGSVLRVNHRLCELTGYTEGEFLGLTIWQLSMPEDVHIQLQAMRERLSSSKSYPAFRIRYRCKDEAYIWVRVTQFLVRLPSGEPYYFFYVVEDIRSQVRAEEERAELLARVQEAHTEALARTRQLEVIFEAITDGLMVCDSAGKIIQSNTALNSVLHLDQYPYYLQLPLEQRLLQMQAFNEQGQRFLKEELPLVRLLRGEDLRVGGAVEMRLVLPKGQDVYLSCSGSPLRDQQEQIIGAVMVIRDVTERRLTEERVQKSFRILLALAEELMHIPGTRRTLSATESATPEKMHDVPEPFQTVGEYLAELTCQMLEYPSIGISLLDPKSGEFHMEALATRSEEEKSIYTENFASFELSGYLDEPAIALLHANEVVVREMALRTPKPFHYYVLIAPMLMDGRLVGVLSVKKREPNASYAQEEVSLVKAVAKLILLVIERERLQQEWIESHTSELALREANRRFDEFLSIASHELRTPLAGIKGNIQLALRRLAFLKSPEVPEMNVLLDKLEKVQDYLIHAEHRVNVQNRMISDLLDVSRIQANKLELVIRPCNLAEIVREAVEDQCYTLSDRVITLTLPANKEVTVLGDADRLGQVVHNYLTNALKYSPVDRPVVVYLETQDGTARVSVKDEGPGLSPEEQKRVWERFYRVKHIPIQGEATPGLGLGLHICRTIIEAHHGNFGLESVPGHGSTFWFELPLVRSTATEQQSIALQEHASGC